MIRSSIHPSSLPNFRLGDERPIGCALPACPAICAPTFWCTDVTAHGLVSSYPVGYRVEQDGFLGRSSISRPKALHPPLVAQIRDLQLQLETFDTHIPA